MSVREAHKGGAPLDGGEGGQVTRGVEELGSGQRPGDNGSPGDVEDTCWGDGFIRQEEEEEEVQNLPV